MSDTHSGKFMGLNALKAKAVKWLEQAGEEAKVHELQQELLERDERIALQGKQIETLQKQMLEMIGDQTPAAPAAPALVSTPVAPAPSLSSELDDNDAEVPAEPEPETKAAAPAKKSRRRRKKAVAPDGEIQNDK